MVITKKYVSSHTHKPIHKNLHNQTLPYIFKNKPTHTDPYMNPYINLQNINLHTNPHTYKPVYIYTCINL